MLNKIQFLVVVLFLVGCKSNLPTTKKKVQSESSVDYQQQIENIEKGIYFRGNGNEPNWNLKISDKIIEFTALKPGYEVLIGNHVEPIRAMDANVKMYKVSTVAGLMTIQIMLQKCVNTMSGVGSFYSVSIDVEKDNNTEHFRGCGNYITDYNLHDIWVLEKLNGKNVAFSDFTKELPNLEINSSTNSFMGFAGCNRMNGLIFFEKGLLQFTNVVTTRMFCGEGNLEAVFLKVLQSATTYEVGNLRLTLSNSSGNELVFKKAD